jgi:hypothetical protein
MGNCLSKKIFDFFGIADDENGPVKPVFLLTIADKSHLTAGSASANPSLAN